MVTLPWEMTTGRPETVRLIVSGRQGRALNRNYVTPKIWKPAPRRTGVEPTRAHGMHALRHLFASVQFDGGTSIRALSEYLGHKDPGFTLRTYTHLMPQAEDKAKSAVDEAFVSLESAGMKAVGAPEVSPRGH